MSRLYELYKKEIHAQLAKSLGLKNPFSVPRLEKIIINCSISDAVGNSKELDVLENEIAAIAGQKPVRTYAKKSIAGFKIREGMPLGVKVTLRKIRMYEFFDRLVTIALPRVRDFRGLSRKSFDGSGNYALGLKEQIVFPEINYDKVSKIRGFNIVVCTSAQTDEHAFHLLKALNLPIY